MAVSEILVSLASNPYFSAGAGLFGVGSLAAVGRTLGQISLAALKRRYVTSLEVPCNDKSYHWLLDWVSREAARTSQQLSVRTDWEEEEGGRVTANYRIEPSPGTHIIRWRGAWIRLDRLREQHQVDVIGGVPWETVTLTTLGRRRGLLLEVLEEARQDVLSRHRGLTTTYTCTASDWRELSRPQPARPLESVVLQPGLADRLAADCERFLGAGAWYRLRGIPHRRGVLLHGPPGCGKTSLILALAGHLGLGISVLNLSDPAMTDSVLQARIADLPRNTILLLEDIDAAFVSRDTTSSSSSAHGGQSLVTLTGLLNALDGVVASEARLTFLTTNYLDRLDPALIRPGRVDIKQLIGYCSHLQAEEMFTKFFPESSELEKKTFVRNIFSQNLPQISTAQIQAHLLLYKDDIGSAISNFEYFEM